MKGIKKFIKMLKRSADTIKCIHVSEEFANALKEKAKLLEIDIKEYKKGGDIFEQYFLFQIPMNFSNIIKKGAVLEMNDGSSIVVT